MNGFTGDDVVMCVFILSVSLDRLDHGNIVRCLTSFAFLIMKMVIINEYIYRMVGSFDAFLIALYLTFILHFLYVIQIMRLLVKKYFDNPGYVVILLSALFLTFLMCFFPKLLLKFVSKLSEEHNNKQKLFQATQHSN
ncbi:uncharacterized protein LOC111620210 [Centruroides sculpturatus]|uniref:uncharacterized protein LOC111620210 n=1 Tax=Centruroides sculpturatus TaxID=218467 RepID=UPI000C6CC9CE|nr:uncharacterized protein LOC111620210 [Centruroides sculpturatus]